MSELSQTEIDAMFNGPSTGDGPLSGDQLKSLEEIHEISMGAGATTLSILLNKQVTFSDLTLKVLARESLDDFVAEACVAIDVPYNAGVDVPSVFLLTQANTSVITDLMMGGDGTAPSPIDDLGLSAISEAVNQMMGMAANTLSSTFDRRVEIALPSAHLVDSPDDLRLPPAFDQGPILAVCAQLSIEGLASGLLVQFLPVSAASGLAEQLKAAKKAPPSSRAEAPSAERTVGATAGAGAHAPGPAPGAPRQPPAKESVVAQSVQFAPLGPGGSEAMPHGLELILDVPLQVTVELGRTRMQIRDVLELGKGSVIELDKLAGEPVDLLVNGKLIARGEVVVIDENFGIRVTDIVSTTERISSFRSS